MGREIKLDKKFLESLGLVQPGEEILRVTCHPDGTWDCYIALEGGTVVKRYIFRREVHEEYAGEL